MIMVTENEAPSSVGSGEEGAVRHASPKLFSHELFRNSSTVCIEHQGEQYWLRLTRGNKLILTK